MCDLNDLKSCVKMLLCFFILIFVISGAGLIAAGVVVENHLSDYSALIENDYGGPGILLVIIGVCIIVLALVGCCGCANDNYCCTMFFAVCLGVIFVLEIAGGIAGFVLRDDIDDEITSVLEDSMPFYSNTTDIRETWDKLQKNFDCCGTDSPNDWAIRSNLTEPPISCCIGGQTCNTAISTDVFDKGCSGVFKDWLKDEVNIIGAVGISIAFIQVVGILFACCLARSIRKEYEIA